MDPAPKRARVQPLNMAFNQENIGTVLHGDYSRGPTSFERQRRIAKLQQKFSRRSTYGRSLGSTYAGYTKARIEDDANGMSYYGQQMANRLNDGFFGRGRYRRYRRRTYRMRRTYRRRRFRGRGLYLGGRGDYFSRLKKLRKKVSSTASKIKTPLDQMLPGAAALAGMVNPAAGVGVLAAGEVASEGLGILEGSHNSNMAGRGLYVGGRGAYTGISGNSLIEGLGTSVPTFATSDGDHGDLVVAHSEFVTDIVGNAWGTDSTGASVPLSTFDMLTISLNPALSKSFPFLSQIAQNFEEYEFLQMIFTYKPKVSSNLSSTDGQVGSVMMYTDYNSNDEAKRSKQQILQAYGHSSDMITKCILHGVECDPAQLSGDGHHFTRVKPPTGANTDYNDFDAGLFQLVVANTPEALSNQVIGELWVSYNVKLKKARTFSVYALGVDRDEAVFPAWQGGFSSDEPDVTLGAWNSIGCSISGVAQVDASYTIGVPNFVAVSDSQIMKIVFPQAFSGDVAITTEVACAVSNLQGKQVRPLLQGNIQFLHVASIHQIHNDWYTQTSNPSPGSEEVMVASNKAWMDTLGQNFLTSTLIGNQETSYHYHQKIYVHVEMAERGIDNVIWVSLPIGSSNIATVIASVSRFNARESTEPDPAMAGF